MNRAGVGVRCVHPRGGAVGGGHKGHSDSERDLESASAGPRETREKGMERKEGHRAWSAWPVVISIWIWMKLGDVVVSSAVVVFFGSSMSLEYLRSEGVGE
jgi:hypothetical protein